MTTTTCEWVHPDGSACTMSEADHVAVQSLGHNHTVVAEALFRRGPAAVEHTECTAVEFRDWYLAISPARQVEVAEQLLESSRVAATCFIANHVARIEAAERGLLTAYERGGAGERARIVWWIRAGLDGPAGMNLTDGVRLAVEGLALVIEQHPERFADAPGGRVSAGGGRGYGAGMTESSAEPTTEVSVETPAKDETTVEVADPAAAPEPASTTHVETTVEQS